jgi:hypothetical protein
MNFPKLLLYPQQQFAEVPVHRIRGRILGSRANPVPNASVTLSKDFGSNITETTKMTAPSSSPP